MKKWLPLIFFSILVWGGYAHGQNGYETFTGNASFNINVTKLFIDDDGNGKFDKYPISFNGKIYLFFIKDGFLVQNANGYYIEFRDLYDKVIVGIKEITVISTDYVKLGKSNKFLLVGTGDFYHPQTDLKGMAYIDATGTLKEDSLGELSSISLSGKIGGGINAEGLSDNITFSVSFRSLLTASAPEAPRITKEALKEMLGNPDVIIIDVRNAYSWQISNFKIKGAVREDPDNVNSWMSNYSKDKTLVFY